MIRILIYIYLTGSKDIKASLAKVKLLDVFSTRCVMKVVVITCIMIAMDGLSHFISSSSFFSSSTVPGSYASAVSATGICSSMVVST